MTDRQQSAFFLMIVFLFTSGISLVIYRQYDQYYQQKTTIDLRVASTTEAPAKNLRTSTTTESISGWKIYKNGQYGFSFQYPSSWVNSYGYASNGTSFKSPDFKSINNDFSITSGAIIHAYVMDNTPMSLDQAAEMEGVQTVGDTIENKKYLTIDGVNAIMFNHHAGEDNDNHAVILFEKANNLFILDEEYSISSQNPYAKVFSDIATIFKFIN